MRSSTSGTPHAGGALAIIGGRFEDDNEAVFAAMHELARGRIAVLPTASSAPDEVGDEARASFLARGFACEVVAITKENCRRSAFDPTIVATLERYGSVYFTGGDQTLIFQALIQDGQPTPALEAIRRCWLAGGLIAGSSAGAAIMSDPMILSGGSVEALVHPPEPQQHDTRLGLGAGLGFFPYGIVDQHFLERGRLGRLVAALLATGRPLGFGIDENTAMIVAEGRLRVVGETGLILVDAGRATGARLRTNIDRIRLSYLDHGDSLDLATLAVTPGPAKRRVRRDERYYRAPTRVGKPAFAGYTVHELMARLVEADTRCYRSETAWAYDHATGTEIAVEITRTRRSKALIETSEEDRRVTALDFGLRLEVRRASTGEYYKNRALSGMVEPEAADRVGRLVLLGSSLRDEADALLAELRRLVTGKVGVIATASAEPRATAAAAVAILERHGIAAVDLGAYRSNLRREEGQRELAERMAGMGAFLITGGNQRRLVDELLYRGEETLVLKALTGAWRQGATIIATSGGAAALSPLMIAGGTSGEALRYGVAPDASHPGLLVEPGLGLFRAGILDQNMVGSHRLGRLIVACAEEAVPFGFGLCEGAGLVVEADRGMRVIGEQGVILVEIDPEGLTLADDAVTLRGVRLALVPPYYGIGPDHRVLARGGNGTGPALTRMLADLEQEIVASAAKRGRPGGVRIVANPLDAHSVTVDIEASRLD
ncbi:MAG: cyanophycinase [Geminicoccaceae bacterium]